MHEATLVFHTSDSLARALHGALSPEATDVPKTTTTLEVAGPELRVRIVAEDLSSLRAALNSYLRWVDAAERAARLGAT